MVEPSPLLALLLHGNQLKRTPRTGWVQRGIQPAEDVAAHSFGVVYATLILSRHIDEAFEMDKALAMATLHDLPEGLTTDIPTPAWTLLPPGIKTSVERQAMVRILGPSAASEGLVQLWEELHRNETPEARLVHDADKLDMYLQATVYACQTGNKQLAEFWERPYTFYYPAAQAVFDELVRLRKKE